MELKVTRLSLVDEVSTDDLRFEIERRVQVANFAQIIRASHESDQPQITTSGLTVRVEHFFGEKGVLIYELHAARGELFVYDAQDISDVGATEFACEVTREEMLVIGDCFENGDAYVEPIIDRVWDA